MKDKNDLSGVKVEQQAATEPVIDQNQFIGRIQPDYFHLPGTLVSFSNCFDLIFSGTFVVKYHL